MADLETEYFVEALRLVKKAGNLVRWAFAQPSSAVTTKASDVDLVTETDQAVEKLLFDGLRAKWPDHKFIGEESAAGGAVIEWTDAPTWIIDPIDGTTNFVHRLPHVCICVGLTIDKKLNAGIVYNPISDELYTARVGQGAFKNGMPIRVSDTTSVSRAILAGGLGIHNVPIKGKQVIDLYLANLNSLITAGFRGLRSLGSAAIHMTFVAEGALDGYVEFGLHCWDMAAAALIITEAGGVCIDPSGGPFELMSRRLICASTRALADDVRKRLSIIEFEHEA